MLLMGTRRSIMRKCGSFLSIDSIQVPKREPFTSIYPLLCGSPSLVNE